MAEIRLIAVPYELGRLRDGVGRGPERLLEAGAEPALAAAGATVTTELVELDREFSNEIDASFELIRRVAVSVREARAAQAFPVVLSGSCLAGIGVVAGLDELAPGVVWFDAHADFNDTERTLARYPTYGRADGHTVGRCREVGAAPVLGRGSLAATRAWLGRAGH